jgi:hypothetical protein
MGIEDRFERDFFLRIELHVGRHFLKVRTHESLARCIAASVCASLVRFERSSLLGRELS